MGDPAMPDDEVGTLHHRYLLLTQIPTWVDRDASLWLDPLWHRDFMGHLRYLRRLTLAAPAHAKGPRDDLIKLEPPPDVELSFQALPRRDSALAAVLGLPQTAWAVARAVAQADIVHSGVAGWPYPLGWVANPLALWMGKPLVVVVESATWRLAGRQVTWKDRLRADITERAARWSVNRAALGIFTQPAYRDSLMTSGGNSMINPASWIDAADVLSQADAEGSWLQKAQQPLRVLFAGRLVPEKGVHVLLDAIRQVDARGVAIQFNIIGEGPLRDACAQVAPTLSVAQLRVLEPLPYGAPFFALLRQQHAVVIPSLSDEQPRLLFDAYAQAVPVLASRTEGIAPHVQHGETGWLFPPGDAAALAGSLMDAAAQPDVLRRLGLQGLQVARGATHEAMHESRREMLVSRFGKGRRR